jgi:hypothetical protein
MDFYRLLGRGIGPTQGLYLHRTTQHRKTLTHIHASSGIRPHDPSVRAPEDSTWLRPRGHYDRRNFNREASITLCYSLPLSLFSELHTFERNLTSVFGSIRECNQKFPDWVDNDINNKKHSSRSNTKNYGGKTHYTDSKNNDTTAPSGR